MRRKLLLALLMHLGAVVALLARATKRRMGMVITKKNMKCIRWITMREMVDLGTLLMHQNHGQGKCNLKCYLKALFEEGYM